MSISENGIFGWFDDVGTLPTSEPPRDAPCLFCGVAVRADDVRTHSLMWGERGYAARSYFYRTHSTCANKFGSLSMDGFVLDMIKRAGQ